MQANIVTAVAKLSDADLLRRVTVLARRDRHVTVELIAHLAELDRRKLYRELGYGSLFSYCTEALGLSEHATFNRIEAARASRSYPAILDRLADGGANLSTVRLLVPHFTPENHERLLAEAHGRSKREVELIVARLAPRPDVVASVRKLPTPAAMAAAPIGSAAPAASPIDSTKAAPGIAGASTTTAGRPTPFAPLAPPPAQRPVIKPLSPDRYRIQFTVSREAQERLRRVQDLLRREIPDGDPGAIFERALTLLLEDLARKMLAATTTPRASSGGGQRSRHIPAAVKRKVWIRDHGQCAFVSRSGRGCRERTFLEFHHVRPYALGGETTVENVSLRCREHNAHEAERVFGPWDPSAVHESRASYSTCSGAATGRHNELCSTRPGASWGGQGPGSGGLSPSTVRRIGATS